MPGRREIILYEKSINILRRSDSDVSPGLTCVFLFHRKVRYDSLWGKTENFVDEKMGE